MKLYQILRSPPPANLERGTTTTIVVAFFLVFVTTGLVLSLEQTEAKRRIVTHQSNRTKALYLAEGGLRLALARINSKLIPNVDGRAGDLETANVSAINPNDPGLKVPTETFGEFLNVLEENSAAALAYGATDVDGDGFFPNFAVGSTFKEQLENFKKEPNGTFRVRVVFPNNNSSVALIRCYAVYGGVVRIMSASGHSQGTTNLFEAGIGVFAGGSGDSTGVRAGGQIIDSYRSSKGYPPNDPEDIAKVTVGSNTTIDLKGNNLDLQGFLGSALGPSAITAADKYQSSVLIDKLPEITLPDLNKTPPSVNDNLSGGFGSNTGSSDFSVGSKKTATLGTGFTDPDQPAQLVAQDLDLKGTVRVEGHVEIYVDSLDMGAQSKLEIAPGGSVKIYITGSAKLNGGGLINEGQIPADFQVFSNSTQEIRVNGGLEMYGVLYAPNAKINALGDAVVYGGIAADSLKFSGSLEFHFDLDLGSKISVESQTNSDLDLTASHEVTGDPTEDN